MAQFMSEHTDLAKNLLPNCAQGRSTARRLWEELSKQLNAEGPPIKNAKLWKKAFADQKYNAKKKLTDNRRSKRQTGGGPYQEKSLTAAEQLIVEAAGLEASVSGNTVVRTFGSKRPASRASRASRSSTGSSNHSSAGSYSSSNRRSTINTPSRPPPRRNTGSSSSSNRSATTNTPSRPPSRRNTGSSSSSNRPAPTNTPCRPTPRGRKGNAKTALLEENIKITAEYQKVMDQKFEILLQNNKRQVEISEKQIKINERQLKIEERQLQISESQLIVAQRVMVLKEEKHKIEMAGKELDLQIKSIELQQLQLRQKINL